MQNSRIYSIYNASVALFIKQGYSKTQISHIAKAIGVSVGTIYHDFTGKKEIMHFILKSTIDPDFLNNDFNRPITDDLFDNLYDEIVKTFENTAVDFSKNLNNAAVNYSFEDLISDAFDILNKYAVGFLFIEKNQTECKKLTECYKIYRQNFFSTMVQYINSFIEKGVVRPLKYVELTTSLIIEMLSYWAMDAKFVSFETYNIPIEQAKEICLDNIISAYKNKL